MKQGPTPDGSPGLRTALRKYMERRQSDRPISIADMIRRTRFALPELQASDNQLELMIAQEIINFGGNIAFDRHRADRLPEPNAPTRDS